MSYVGFVSNVKKDLLYHQVCTNKQGYDLLLGIASFDRMILGMD